MRLPVAYVVPECCYSVVFFFPDWLMNPGVRNIPAVNGTQSTRVRRSSGVHFDAVRQSAEKEYHGVW